MIPLSAVDIGERERAYVRDAMETGWISSTGAYVERFEAALGERLRRAHVVSTCSGTAALELALRALGVGPGDEVILPALTFAAPASAVVHAGAAPRFVDVEPGHWTLDPARVREAITPRTRLVIAVDVLGHPCDFDALSGLGVPILEDAAQAHGATCRGRPTGSFGVASIMSFHANKAISTGEGGCVATDDPMLAERLRLLNAHGMERTRPYHHPVAGHNFRMTNLAAAVGLAQVERWDELVAARRAVSARYDDGLDGAAVVRRPVAEWAREATWLHTIAVERRADVCAAAREAGADVRAIWPLVPHQDAFATEGDWPVARAVTERAVWLPTAAGMSVEDVDRVVRAVRRGLGDT